MYFHPYLEKESILTNIFQPGWFNHQQVKVYVYWQHVFQIGCWSEMGWTSDSISYQFAKISLKLGHQFRLLWLTTWFPFTLLKAEIPNNHLKCLKKTCKYMGFQLPTSTGKGLFFSEPSTETTITWRENAGRQQIVFGKSPMISTQQRHDAWELLPKKPCRLWREQFPRWRQSQLVRNYGNALAAGRENQVPGERSTLSVCSQTKQLVGLILYKGISW